MRMDCFSTLGVYDHGSFHHFSWLQDFPSGRLSREARARTEATMQRAMFIVSPVADSKERWVNRSPDPSDRRFTLAMLSSEGWDQALDTAPDHVALVRSLAFDPPIKAQKQQLRAISQRIKRWLILRNAASAYPAHP